MKPLISFLCVFFLASSLNAQTFSLQKPINNYTSTNPLVYFEWSGLNNSFTLEISSDSAFSVLLYSQNTSNNVLTINLTSQKNKHLYWRIKDLMNNTYTNLRYLYILDLNAAFETPIWLKGDFTIGNSSGLDEWTNLGNDLSFHFTQTIPNRKPSASNELINGFSAVRFNLGKELVSNNILLTDIGTYTYVLAKPFANQNLQPKFIFDQGSVSNTGFGISLTDSRVINYLSTAIGGGFFSLYESFFNTFIQQELNFIDSELNLIVNNSSTVSNSISTPSLDSTTISNFPMKIGGQAKLYDASRCFIGDIYEVIIIKDTIFQTELDKNIIPNYFMTKYFVPLNLGMDTSVCGDFYNLKLPNNAYSQITWSNGQTNVDSITATSSGTYWVTVKSFGLSLTDSITIELRDKPQLNFQNDTISCVENELFLTYTNLGPYEYSWSNGVTDDTLFNLSSGTYFVSQNDTVNQCIIHSDPVNIYIDSFSIQSSLGADRNFCLGSNLELQTTSTNNEPYNYNWSTLDTNSYIVLNSPTDTIISIEVTDAFGCQVKDTITANVLNLASPFVDFISDTVCFGNVNNFLSTAIASGSDVINDYEWSFPNNTTITGVTNASYEHFNDGTYNVNLTVYTDSNCENSLTKPVYLHRLPVVNFNLEIVCEKNPIQFNENSFAYFPDNIFQYSWYIDNVLESNMEDPNLIFHSQGKQELKLVIETDLGCRNEYLDTVEVFPALKANFSFTNNCIGDSISFIDETQSLSIVNWNWTFNSFNSSSLQNPKFQYNTLGTQTVNLEIQNALGCISNISKNVEISPQPIASFEFDKACLSDTTLFFDNSIVSLDSIEYSSWTIESNLFSDDSIQYIFSDEIDYVIKHSIITQKACFDDTVMTITINPLPNPAFTFTPDYGTAPLEVSFSNETTDADTYNWSFGDSGNSNDVNPNYTYNTNGIYNVTLKAINEFNCENTKTEQIAIIPSELDLEVEKLNLVLSQNNNNTILNANVLLSNVGTRIIGNADLILRLDNGDVLAQQWTGSLGLGEIIDYSFDSYFIISDVTNSKYVCVEAINVNDGTELNLANNKTCKLIDGNIQFSTPYPNPANNFVNMDVVTKDKGICRIDVVNMLGEVLETQTAIDLQKGYNKIQVETAKYQSGKYFLKVTFLEEKYLYSFVVK